MSLTSSETRPIAAAAASSGPHRRRADVAGVCCRTRFLSIVIAVLGALALPTAAQAADVLSVTAPKGACRVLVGRKLVAVGGRAGLRVTARLAVNPHAATGRYTVTLRCAGAAPASTVVSVARSRRARRGAHLLSGVTFTVRAPTFKAPPPPPEPPTTPSWQIASDWWAGAASAYTAAFRNGQCTDLAEWMRPDIVATVAQAVYAEYLEAWNAWQASGERGPTPDEAAPDWNATAWDRNAEAAGMAVGTTPRVGAIMVFHSSDESSWPGHVAYVNQVNPDGSVLITEENNLSLWVVDQRTVTPADTAGQSVDYIY
jgi:hypothetical protein